MSTFLDIIARTAVSFVLIMIIARIIGKHTITQLTYHDFVSSITLGALTANIAFNTYFKTWLLIASLLTFSGIAYIIAYITMKNRTLRKWFSGKPTVLIEGGKVLEHNLRKLKFSLDTLNQELREKDIFNIEEVEYAIIELNGKLSVLKKPEYRTVTRKDLSLPQVKDQFPIEVIMDGKVISENIQKSGISSTWLTQQLEKRKLDVEQICYAVQGTNGKLFIDLYEDQIRHPIDVE